MRFIPGACLLLAATLYFVWCYAKWDFLPHTRLMVGVFSWSTLALLTASLCLAILHRKTFGRRAIFVAAGLVLTFWMGLEILWLNTKGRIG